MTNEKINILLFSCTREI